MRRSVDNVASEVIRESVSKADDQQEASGLNDRECLEVVHQDIHQGRVDHSGTEQESRVVKLELALSSANGLKRVSQELSTASSEGSRNNGRGDNAFISSGSRIRLSRDREGAECVEACAGSNTHDWLLGKIVDERDRIVVDDPPTDGPSHNGRIGTEEDRASLGSCGM